jgi:UDP-N-acetylglucosamine--N-acetylmuramyl-(pentapeptide) pyrophosphoryl-undecaprenol N-acetylglucosamine transferase
MDDGMARYTAGRTALLAGGGTAGHVFPGLPVAAELGRRGWRVSWVGRSGGMEEALVRARGLEFHALPAAAVIGQGALGRVRALATLASSALKARRLMRELDARVVVGTGGYVAAPACLGARLAGRPILLVEPNARAGAANRWLSRLARCAAVAYPRTSTDLRCPSHLTGVPVRDEFFAAGERPAGAPPRVLVLGGSQGALQLNHLLPEAFSRLASYFPRLSVLHQVGRAHVDVTREAYDSRDLGTIEVEIVPFLDDVAAAMSGADLVVSRAGAVTLAEICAAGRPAILIPLGIAGGHQADNAAGLEAARGAVLLAGERANPDALSGALSDLLGDEERRLEMGRALRRLARRDAASRIADLVESTAGGA